MLLSEMKKQASSFIQDKYRTARLILTDVTPAELLTEEATNNDPCGPDARTMAKISEAAYDIDDYWRIVDILHQRLYIIIDLKQWRQHYKSMVLLDFLLTHGPESIVEEFLCDVEVIQDLSTFKHIDERGFDWGATMQKRGERILQLLEDEEFLKDERLKAYKLSNEIQGFGNLNISPSSSRMPRTSSFSSYSSSSSSAWTESEEVRLELQPINREIFHGNSPVSQEKPNSPLMNGENIGGTHLWDTPIEETGSLLDPENNEEAVISSKPNSNSSPGRRDGGKKAVFQSITNVGKVMMKRFDRQFSLGI
ncbi:hypothetical protein ACLOJK_011435 [Asimina triloba]